MERKFWYIGFLLAGVIFAVGVLWLASDRRSSAASAGAPEVLLSLDDPLSIPGFPAESPAPRAETSGASFPPPSTEDPGSAEAFEHALAAIRVQQLDDAERWLHQAIGEGNNLRQAHAVLGSLRQQRQSYGEAAESFSEAILLDPKPEYFLMRAECEAALGNMAEARADFDRAAELAPSQPLITNKRYLFLIRQGEKKSVQDRIDLELEIGITSAMPSWVMAAAAIQLENGQTEAAVSLLQNARTLLGPQDFSRLLRDPLFQKYRNRPGLASFF